MAKKISLLFIFFSLTASAQEYEIIHVEGRSINVGSNVSSTQPSPIQEMVIEKNACRKNPADCEKLIYTYIELDDGKKLSAHLRSYPLSIQLLYKDWMPVQWAVFLKKRNALRSMFAYLIDHDMLEQVYQRGDENGPPEFISSASDLNPRLVNEILAELQETSDGK